MWGGQISANAFVRNQPGHLDTVNRDLGGALRFNLGF
jgi:hypothetical protein